MGRYSVEVTDQFAVELDLPPGAPAPVSMSLGWTAVTEADLEDQLVQLGFDIPELDPASNCFLRHVRLSRDGERIGMCTLTVVVSGKLTEQPRPAIPAVQRLVENAQRMKAAAVTRVGYPTSDALPGEGYGTEGGED